MEHKPNHLPRLQTSEGSLTVPLSLLRRPTETEYPADWVLRSNPRVTVGKSNTLNGRYVQSVVWTIYFEHEDKSVSAMTTCCNLRDVKSMAKSGELDKLINKYGG